MDTTGDKVQNMALSKIGEKSLFTKELEIALNEHKIDFIVHSLKDLPSVLPDGMRIGAMCKRGNPYDCVLFHPKHHEIANLSLQTLPHGSVIGSSSVRRVSQLKRSFPHLKFKDIRGNVGTRYKKMIQNNDYDGIVLAKAGIDRLNWQKKVGQVLTGDECYYAVGQGAIAVEIRQDDVMLTNMMVSINDKPTELCCTAERTLMRQLEGGCSAPVAVLSLYDNETRRAILRGACFSIDGNEKVIFDSMAIVNNLDDAVQLGKAVAEGMFRMGARTILEKAHKATHASIT